MNMNAQGNRRPKIYIDMDGVLAVWNPDASIEDTYQPGYFRELNSESGIKELVDMLIKDEEVDAEFLTAAYFEGTAMADKRIWLDRLGFTEDVIHTTFVPYGVPKHKFVPVGNNVLIDDFSKNLHEWEAAGYKGVKFYNGINGTKGTWNGFSINRKQSADKMFCIVKAVAKS